MFIDHSFLEALVALNAATKEIRRVLSLEESDYPTIEITALLGGKA